MTSIKSQVRWQRTFSDKTAGNSEQCTLNGAGTIPRMYEDKEGIPVIYDAATEKQRPQEKIDVSSVLWHELLSPVTLIKGYTSTLLELDDSITEEQKERYLQGIDSACNRIVRLLENLRNITQLDGSRDANRESISLVDLARCIVSDTQKRTSKHVIKLHTPAPLPRIKVNPQKIELVINNLLTNAMKYSPQGGDIEVEICLVQKEQALRRLIKDNAPFLNIPCLVLSVADDGIGIPERELDQIFQKFYRVHNPLTNNIQGVGLGLYICKLAVKAHGGQIWARNRLSGGSIFSFSLPLD